MSDQFPAFRRLRGYAFDPGLNLQVDQPLAQEPPPGVSRELWDAFLRRTREEALYFEHTIVDEPA